MDAHRAGRHINPHVVRAKSTSVNFATARASAIIKLSTVIELKAEMSETALTR